MANEKYISLTFDDGPTIGITDKVLDILEENQITASFFLIGNQITKETEYLVKRAHAMGCTIENHTMNHPFLTQLSDEEILNEVEPLTKIITELTGEKPEYFRPPYIDYNQKLFDLIDLNFICGIGCEDWVLEIPAEVRVERMLADAKPGNIVLLHDMKDNINTVEALKVIIPELKKQGYTFVTVRDIFKLTGITPEKNKMYSGTEIIRVAQN